MQKPKFTDQQFLQQYNKGLYDTEIAYIFNVTHSTIEKRRWKLNLLPNYQIRTSTIANPKQHLQETTQQQQKQRYQRGVSWQQTHKQQQHELNVKYYKNHKKQSSERLKKWRQQHLKQYREHSKKYRQQHLEQRKKYMRQYRKQHKNQIHQQQKGYRIHKKQHLLKTEPYQTDHSSRYPQPTDDDP